MDGKENPRAGTRAEGTEGRRWGGQGKERTGYGPRDAHSSHPPPHLSVTGSLSSQGAGDGDDKPSLGLRPALLG